MGEFRALWASQILSVGGDRLALVALTILVYDRTRSPLLAAIAFAAGTLPYIVGALFLAALADRFPRRTVMVVTDVARMALVAAMLIPATPLPALIALLYAVTTFQPVFDAARSAIIRDIVPMDKYALAAGTLQSTMRILIVAGAAAGGVLVALRGRPMGAGRRRGELRDKRADRPFRPAREAGGVRRAKADRAAQSRRRHPAGIRRQGAAHADNDRLAGRVL